MPMYRYVKALPWRPMPRPVVLSYALITTGTLILLWTVWPIVSFMVFEQQLLVKTVSPLGEIVASRTIPAPAALAQSSDFTNPNLWFPTKPQKKVVAPVNSYTLSIPRLGIEGATTIIAGDDLVKGLIHYGGTALPGEYGNTVIFGHSTLPQFFKGAKDYKSIFSTLPSIKEGDEIFITYDGVTYRYTVYEKVVVEPTDLSPLEQRFDDSYVTLVTCVPPGTYLMRLNVKARLVRPT